MFHLTRLEQESQFSLGRSTEINRDEVKFQKFIDRLRKRFSMLFTGILKKQLLLKNLHNRTGLGKLEEQYSELTSKEITTFTELKNAESITKPLGVS